jgi:hypothetical protein
LPRAFIQEVVQETVAGEADQLRLPQPSCWHPNGFRAIKAEASDRLPKRTPSYAAEPSSAEWAVEAILGCTRLAAEKRGIENMFYHVLND